MSVIFISFINYKKKGSERVENINISKIYKFKLDTKESKPQKFGIVANRYDSVLFRVNITENKVVKDLTGANISIVIIKENGDIERQTLDIEITNPTQGAVDILLKNSCVDSVGTCMAQIIVSDDNEAIRTSKFIYVVNEIIDGEIIVEASDKLSTMNELDRKLDILYQETLNNINTLNDKISEFGNLFSGDYNDLTNKPEIPIIDVNKSYVDSKLLEKVNHGTVYTIDETYNKYEIQDVVSQAITSELGDLSIYAKQENVNSSLENKVDKVIGKGLSSNDYSNEDKEKVKTFVTYVHPNDANTRHISDAERLYWNDKADNRTVNSSSNGLMTPAQKSKLDGIDSYANNYTHPSTHLASIILQDKNNRFVTDAEKESWNQLINKVNDILIRIQALENK